MSISDQAGVVSEDVVTDACTVGQVALAACALTPAAPGCAVAETACGVYSAVKGIFKLFG